MLYKTQDTRMFAYKDFGGKYDACCSFPPIFAKALQQHSAKTLRDKTLEFSKRNLTVPFHEGSQRAKYTQVVPSQVSYIII